MKNLTKRLLLITVLAVITVSQQTAASVFSIRPVSNQWPLFEQIPLYEVNIDNDTQGVDVYNSVSAMSGIPLGNFSIFISGQVLSPEDVVCEIVYCDDINTQHRAIRFKLLNV